MAKIWKVPAVQIQSSKPVVLYSLYQKYQRTSNRVSDSSFTNLATAYNVYRDRLMADNRLRVERVK